MKMIIAALLVFSMNAFAKNISSFDSGSQYRGSDEVLRQKIAWAEDQLVKVLAEELNCTNVQIDYRILGRPTWTDYGYFDSEATAICPAPISFFYYNIKAGHYDEGPTEVEIAWVLNGKRVEKKYQTTKFN